MYAFGTRKGLVCKKKESKCNNMIKQYKKTNFDNATKEIIKEHNTNWPQIHDHPYWILIIWGSGSWTANSLFNPIDHQPNIEKKLFIC